MRGLCMLDDRAEEQRRIMDQRAHSNKKLRFRSERKLLPLPPPIFLICRTGFLVILRYSQIQICDIGSLFYDHTTYCLTKRYA
jgi:hypothetical protein